MRRIAASLRGRVVILLAAVLALESADATAVGAAAPQLEASLHISNLQLGLLAAISTLVGAVATIPVGSLADRVNRSRLLALTIVCWALAMLAGASALSYEWLLLSRIGLGVLTAAAGPMVASLTGDYFPATERARIYGYILSGELLGAGFGFVVSGSVASLVSWRGAFAVLALPALALAVLVWRGLPEPERGREGALIPTSDRGQPGTNDAEDPDAPAETARRAVVAQGVAPIASRILREDPGRLPLTRAIRYVLSIPTNRWLIAASAIGYFFFAGLRTFGLVFARGHFALGQASATLFLFFAGLGSLAGVLLSGRVADWLISRGHLSARVLVGAVAYVLAALVLVPALLLTSIGLAVFPLMLGAAALAAPNPPLDAARLDVMPSRMWGRAEGVRTCLRQLAQGAAPLLFGLLADVLASGSGDALGATQVVSPARTLGLQYAFLLMLLPLVMSGGFLLRARSSYPADVASALASEPSADGGGQRESSRVRTSA